MNEMVVNPGGDLVPGQDDSSVPFVAPHSVRFYEDEADLVAAASGFIAEGLANQDLVLVIAVDERRVAFLQALRERGLDVEHATAAGLLTFVDADELLASFMRGALPDRELFFSELRALLERLPSGARLRAYGEMVDVLWKRGAVNAALLLEELWNELQHAHGFSLLCAYLMAGFYKQPAGLREVCARHTHVLEGGARNEALGIADGPRSDEAPGEPTRALSAEISRRMEVERALRGSLGELRQAEGKLLAAQRELLAVTNALPTLVCHINSERRYTFANVAYERWLGIERKELLGKHMREVLGESAYQAIAQHVATALAGQAVKFEARLDYRLGGERFVEASYVPRVDRDGHVLGFVGLIADISERKRAESAREAAAQRAERLMKVTTAIADAVTPDQVYDAIVDQTATALGASSAGLWRVSDPERATLLRAVGYSEAQCRQLEQLDLRAQPLIPAHEAIATGKPVWIESQAALLDRYPHLRATVTLGRRYRIACLPVSVQERLLGALAFTFEGEAAIDGDERTFLMLIARYSGQALERLRSLEAEQRSRANAEAAVDRLAILSRASRAFSEASRNLPQLLETIAQQVTQDYADACAIMLAAGDRVELVAEHHRDGESAALARALLAAAPPKLGEGISGRVAETGESILLPRIDTGHVGAAARPDYRAWVDRFAPSSVIVVALRARGATLGVLSAIRLGERKPFGEEDLHLMEELAERAAMAIEGSRLLTDNHHGRMRAELLYGLAAAANAAGRVEQVFESALAALERALGASRASILAFDPDGVMRFKAWRGLSDEYRRAVEGHSPWSRDVRAPEPILVADAELDPAMSAYLPLFREEGIRALGFIPLVASGRLIGKFMVYYERPRELAAHEIELATAIANHVAAAIDRFTVIEELQRTVHFNELFTGMLGHDLRNPLGAIMTGAQLAVSRSSDERVLKPLSRILTSGTRMARMIDQLLDFTRLRVGAGIPIERRRCELEPLLRQAIDELEHARPASSIAIECAGDTTGTWDADRLLQVFSNLVANAVQHGATGEVARVRVDGTGRAEVRVSVHNAGAIPAELVPRLFEPMAAGERRRERSQGLGLGLFITREILKAHGGAIEVRSSEQDGTTFTISLPRTAASEQR
jgi:PAS domain S-box-containing protein